MFVYYCCCCYFRFFYSLRVFSSISFPRCIISCILLSAFKDVLFLKKLNGDDITALRKNNGNSNSYVCDNGDDSENNNADVHLYYCINDNCYIIVMLVL